MVDMRLSPKDDCFDSEGRAWGYYGDKTTCDSQEYLGKFSSEAVGKKRLLFYSQNLPVSRLLVVPWQLPLRYKLTVTYDVSNFSHPSDKRHRFPNLQQFRAVLPHLRRSAVSIIKLGVEIAFNGMCQYVVYESMDVPHPVYVVVTYENCHMYKTCAKVNIQHQNLVQVKIIKTCLKVKLQ